MLIMTIAEWLVIFFSLCADVQSVHSTALYMTLLCVVFYYVIKSSEAGQLEIQFDSITLCGRV